MSSIVEITEMLTEMELAYHQNRGLVDHPHMLESPVECCSSNYKALGLMVVLLGSCGISEKVTGALTLGSGNISTLS